MCSDFFGELGFGDMCSDFFGELGLEFAVAGAIVNCPRTMPEGSF